MASLLQEFSAGMCYLSQPTLSYTRPSDVVVSMTKEKAKPAEISCSKAKKLKEISRPLPSSPCVEDHIIRVEVHISHYLDHFDTVHADKATLASLLRSCGDAEALLQGKRLHTHIMNSSTLATDTFIGNLLVQMYSKCNSLKDAVDVFTNIQHKNVYSWSLMLGACIQHGEEDRALSLFHQMRLEGVTPDKVTYVTILDACTSKSVLGQGERIHAEVVEHGFEMDVFVGTALLSMYGRCDTLDAAGRMFNRMPTRNVVSWNALGTACIRHGKGNKALESFWLMQQSNVTPSNLSFLSALEACNTLEEGKMIHNCIRHFDFESDNLVSTALISMYGKLGRLDDAHKVFENLSMKTAVSWNAMIAVYAQHGQGRDALQLYNKMELNGVSPGQATFASILSACALEAALVEGERIHSRTVCIAMDHDILLVNALIDMYGNCGHLETAQEIFSAMCERTVSSWNIIIGAHALHGKARDALVHFQEMLQEGALPDKFTFYNILSGCSHAGLVNEAHLYFLSMQPEFGVTPTVEHYNCLIDLLGRVGRLDEGEGLMNDMPVVPTFSSWMSLLNACKLHTDTKRANRAAGFLFISELETAGPYVVLSHTLQLLSG